MRVIAGSHRGRRLEAPPGDAVRPTAGRIREAVFNILAHGGWGPEGGSALSGARVLDAFAGSGALGLEALSRGAAVCTFLDKDAAALDCARRNVALLGEAARATLIRADALRPPPAGLPATLAFLDPPYGRDLPGPALTALAEQRWFAAGALIVLETASRDAPPSLPFCEILDERRYRLTKIYFLRFRNE
ncbi:MAG: 16S rRNA (guanine(966)-N(2))-methyltransferase RsmD [Rhodospirillaceae bacterium]